MAGPTADQTIAELLQLLGVKELAFQRAHQQVQALVSENIVLKQKIATLEGEKEAHHGASVQ